MLLLLLLLPTLLKHITATNIAANPPNTAATLAAVDAVFVYIDDGDAFFAYCYSFFLNSFLWIQIRQFHALCH